MVLFFIWYKNLNFIHVMLRKKCWTFITMSPARSTRLFYGINKCDFSLWKIWHTSHMHKQMWFFFMKNMTHLSYARKSLCYFIFVVLKLKRHGQLEQSDIILVGYHIWFITTIIKFDFSNTLFWNIGLFYFARGVILVVRVWHCNHKWHV